MQLQTVLAMYKQEGSVEAELSEVEDHGKETHRSNDQDTKI